MPIFLLGNGLSTLPPRHSSQKRTSLSGRPAAVWAAPRRRRSQAAPCRRQSAGASAGPPPRPHAAGRHDTGIPRRRRRTWPAAVSLHLGHEGFFLAAAVDDLAQQTVPAAPRNGGRPADGVQLAVHLLQGPLRHRWRSSSRPPRRVPEPPVRRLQNTTSYLCIYIYIYTSTYRYRFLCILRMHVLQCCSSTASRER